MIRSGGLWGDAANGNLDEKNLTPSFRDARDGRARPALGKENAVRQNAAPTPLPFQRQKPPRWATAPADVDVVVLKREVSDADVRIEALREQVALGRRREEKLLRIIRGLCGRAPD